ncbi:MAG: ABC transporter ATP-binding protein [Bacteroidales bacterium]|jgi:cobalt/nickel transport system ATP-binding protein|nr:ABC transporter ATP-binding protein [Bacteroidales bacterium]
MAAGIRIEDLSFSYNPGKRVLKSVSLEIRAGEKFGIVGPSGSGKSTLLLHLNGVLRGVGRVTIGETPVTAPTLADVRRLVGLVFQNPDDQLFNPTVEDDVAFGPLNFGLPVGEVRLRVDETLASLSLNGYEKLTPHHLSLGERKRVALATVLSMRPDVIAFDEPFSNLDPSMVHQLMEIIRPMESTVVIVSQSVLPVISLCDRMAILRGGEIVACGPPRELARDTGLMKSSGLDLTFYCDICRELRG